MHLLGVTDQELQALLSQKDIATSFAENLLKQFGSDDLDIKEEMPEEASAGTNVMNDCGGVSSPISAAAADSTTNSHTKSPPIKCEATSTSVAGFQTKCDIKNEPVVKIEKLFDPTEKLTFTTQMDSKQMADVVKYVTIFLSN